MKNFELQYYADRQTDITLPDKLALGPTNIDGI